MKVIWRVFNGIPSVYCNIHPITSLYQQSICNSINDHRKRVSTCICCFNEWWLGVCNNMNVQFLLKVHSTNCFISLDIFDVHIWFTKIDKLVISTNKCQSFNFHALRSRYVRFTVINCSVLNILFISLSYQSKIIGKHGNM